MFPNMFSLPRGEYATAYGAELRSCFLPSSAVLSVDVPESMSKITGLMEAHKLLCRRAWKQLRGCTNLDYPQHYVTT